MSLYRNPVWILAWLSLCFILERSWVALYSDVCQCVRHRCHLTKSPLFPIYTGIQALYWPNTIYKGIKALFWVTHSILGLVFQSLCLWFSLQSFWNVKTFTWWRLLFLVGEFELLCKLDQVYCAWLKKGLLCLYILYWVSKGLVCLYILEKVEIWSGVTDAWHTDRQTDIRI